MGLDRVGGGLCTCMYCKNGNFLCVMMCVMCVMLCDAVCDVCDVVCDVCDVVCVMLCV